MNTYYIPPFAATIQRLDSYIILETIKQFQISYMYSMVFNNSMLIICEMCWTSLLLSVSYK